LRTDIAGAVRAGLDSLLIAGGVYAAEFSNGGELDLGRVAVALTEHGLQPIGVMPRFVW
jgi:ribonucleotide monophosphatase NagD (HAD superfamily)